MNTREGMRRLGLVLAIMSTAACAVFFSYPRLRSLEKKRRDHNESARLASSATVQRELAAIRNTPWVYTATKDADGNLTIRNDVPPDQSMSHYRYTAHSIDEVFDYYWKGPRKPTLEDANEISLRQLDDAVKGHQSASEEVQALGLDASGKVLWFRKRDGREVSDQGAPPFSQYVFPVVLPVLGFLIPCGIFATIMWIAMGFRTAPSGGSRDGK